MNGVYVMIDWDGVFNSLVIDLEMLPSVRECHCLLLYCTTAVVQECPDSSSKIL